jgi:hypothetical protein
MSFIEDEPRGCLETASKETDKTQHDQPTAKSAQDQPFSNGFFDKDPITSSTRAKFLIAGTMSITVAIWVVLAMYWGALWKTEILVHHLNGWVVVRL